MRSPTDPLRHLRQTSIVTVAVGVCAVLCCAIWACLSLDHNLVPNVELTEPPLPSRSSTHQDTLDLEIFQTTLWVPRIQETPDTSEQKRVERRSRPPAFVLLGVVTGDAEPRAALYDAAQRTLHVLRVGETLGDYTIKSISNEHVVLSEQEFQHELPMTAERASFAEGSPS